VADVLLVDIPSNLSTCDGERENENSCDDEEESASGGRASENESGAAVGCDRIARHLGSRRASPDEEGSNDGGVASGER